VRWRLERDAQGAPKRMIRQAPCPACHDRGWVWLMIGGARAPQRRPCGACSLVRVVEGISPKPLEVLP
jgi:hypothetical protein